MRKPLRLAARFALESLNGAASLVRSSRKFPLERVRRVVIFAPFSGLGNLILWIPALRSLKKTWPQAEVTLVGPKLEIAQPLIAENLVKRVIEFRETADKSLLRQTIFVLDNVRILGADVAICTFLEPTRSASWWAWLSGAPIRIGYGSSAETVMLTDRLEVDPKSHEIDRNLKTVVRIGASPVPPPLELKVDDYSLKWADGFLLDLGVKKPFVAMHPGSAPGKRERRKRWPAERFAEVASRLDERGIKSLVFEGPADSDDVEKIDRLAGDAVRVVRENDVGKVAALLKESSVVLANDSGLMHLASAVGAPVVAIFGPTDPVKNAPPGDRSTVLIKPCERAPCYLDAEAPCDDGDAKCLTGTGVEEVVDAVVGWIEKKTRA